MITCVTGVGYDKVSREITVGYRAAYFHEGELRSGVHEIVLPVEVAGKVLALVEDHIRETVDLSQLVRQSTQSSPQGSQEN